ncbi:MAG: aminotransferase class IV [Cyanobacteria bacterium J06600_6]
MFWYDGKLIQGSQLLLDVSDPGLCYGASSFSTMRVYDRSLTHPLTKWQAHCDRLEISLKAFDWQQPDWQRLKQGALILLEHFPILRLAIFPNGKEWITGRSLPSDLKQRQADGIVAWVAQGALYRRNSPHYKTGNYLPAYLARSRALQLKSQEAILIDRDGNWLETSTGNLWGWDGDHWYTPHLDSGILPGIARSHWIEYFQARKIEVTENIWTPKFIATIQAIAYSNCVVDFVPIKMIMTQNSQTNYLIKRP